MRMRTEKRAIDKIFRRRDRYEIPDWQRGEVWSKEKKQKLIDTILRGWKLPKFYFTGLVDDEIEVVDGQQRLNAIFEFFSNELPLSQRSAKEFGAEYYKDLSTELADRFEDFEVEFDLIEDASEIELKEFFQRLQDGLPLTSSEKLNSEHSKLRDFCRAMAQHSFFIKKVLASNKRYGHFDIVAKVAAIEIEGLDVGLRYDELKAVFDSQASFSPISRVGKRIKTTLDHLDAIFPRERDTLLRNRTIVQSFATLLCRVIETENISEMADKLYQFFRLFMAELVKQVELGNEATDHDYLAFQATVNANVRSGAKIRHEILLRKLLAFEPGFFELLNLSETTKSGLGHQIKRLGESIGKLMPQINEEYAGKHGEDLFKATNRTARALVALSKPIIVADASSYGKFIDDLYFLLHEGPGNRLGSNKPQSFSDIKTLRTMIRHDLDHGKPSDIRTKRKQAASVFRKFAGNTSPETISPERFPVIQTNLLSAIDRDLRNLLKNL